MQRILVKMISKITCLVFLLRLINKDIFFYFTIIISGKSYFKNWNNILYSQRCFTFLSIFHISRFGCTTSFSLSFNKPRKPKFPNEKISHGIQHQYRYLFRIRERDFIVLSRYFRPWNTEDGRRTIRNLRGSRIA